MVKIALKYEGDLHVAAVHGPSGTLLQTDAPVDNQGKGESFSPTDLVATALGSCMATTMGIVARRENLDLKGMEIHVEKHMSKDPPRRIQALDVQINVPAALDREKQKLLEQTALTCPVAQSISPQIDVRAKFTWKQD